MSVILSPTNSLAYRPSIACRSPMAQSLIWKRPVSASPSRLTRFSMTLIRSNRNCSNLIPVSHFCGVDMAAARVGSRSTPFIAADATLWPQYQFPLTLHPPPPPHPAHTGTVLWDATASALPWRILNAPRFADCCIIAIYSIHCPVAYPTVPGSRCSSTVA